MLGLIQALLERKQNKSIKFPFSTVVLGEILLYHSDNIKKTLN